MYCRIDCFGQKTGWQGWNADPEMEKIMARLPGSGSFYWPSEEAARQQAQQWLADGVCRAARIETISGKRLDYLHAPERIALAA